MIGAAKMGMDIRLAGPRPCWPQKERVDQARAVARETGACITLTENAEAAVRGCDFLYTDVWVSMGEEQERTRRLARLRRFQVTPELMGRAKPGAFFLHCLPAHRGEEVAAEVIDGPASAVWQQAANRLPTEQALLHLLIA